MLNGLYTGLYCISIPEIFLKSVSPEEFVIEWGEPRLYGGVRVRGYQVGIDLTTFIYCNTLNICLVKLVFTICTTKLKSEF